MKSLCSRAMVPLSIVLLALGPLCIEAAPAKGKSKKVEGEKIEATEEGVKVAPDDSPALGIEVGDLIFPKVPLIFEAGESAKPFENSTFEPGMNRPATGRCETILAGSTEQRRAYHQIRSIGGIEMSEDIPELDRTLFFEEVKKSFRKLFEKAFAEDAAEVLAFRNDDLKMFIPALMDEEPWIRLPKKLREPTSQMIFTEVWKVWGDVSRQLKKPMAEIKKNLSKKQSEAEKRMIDRLKGKLAGKKAPLSDQLIVYQVQIEVGSPPALTLKCDLQGESRHFSLDRMNRILSPYFQVIPRDQFSEMDLHNSLPPRSALPTGVVGL